MPRATVPLATIAIPTFNRAESLKRAVTSARAQDYPEIEILIVDNASPDGTEETCRSLAREDPRIRYVRQMSNVGPVRNFETGLEQARGTYFMWLADDDWISPNYVRRCIEELERGGHVLVAGRDYWCSQTGIKPEPRVCAPESSAELRMLNYARNISSNAAVYGLSRVTSARSCLPFPKGIGGDILWVFLLLRDGTLTVLDDAALVRTTGGTSSDFYTTARMLGHRHLSSKYPHILVTLTILSGLARRPRGGTLRHRLLLATRISFLTAMHQGALGDVTSPVRLRLQRHVPDRLYRILRTSYRPVRHVQRRLRTRILG